MDLLPLTGRTKLNPKHISRRKVFIVPVEVYFLPVQSNVQYLDICKACGKTRGRGGRALYQFQIESCYLPPPSPSSSPPIHTGYAFLLFREEASVQRLVKSCISEDGKLYIFVSSVTQINKKVSDIQTCTGTP